MGSLIHSLSVVLLAVCIGVSDSDDKVVVGYYAESLCPYCLALSNGPLNDAFEKVSFHSEYPQICSIITFAQIPNIFVLNYVPWGNAKLESPGVIDCQHGPMECIMNTVMACVLHYYPSQ